MPHLNFLDDFNFTQPSGETSNVIDRERESLFVADNPRAGPALVKDFCKLLHCANETRLKVLKHSFEILVRSLAQQMGSAFDRILQRSRQHFVLIGGDLRENEAHRSTDEVPRAPGP